jgi:hypothetical protein
LLAWLLLITTRAKRKTSNGFSTLPTRFFAMEYYFMTLPRPMSCAWTRHPYHPHDVDDDDHHRNKFPVHSVFCLGVRKWIGRFTSRKNYLAWEIRRGFSIIWLVTKTLLLR